MNSRYARSLEELKERILTRPLETIADSEIARCIKEETLRSMSDNELKTLLIDKRFVWLLTCDKVRNAPSREKLYALKKNLLRAVYNLQSVEREMRRREVQSDDSVQQLPTPATPTTHSDPSLEDLDSFDLDLVCFEDLADTLDTGSDVQQGNPADELDPIPLDFDIDELPDFTPEELDCLFD